MEPRPGGAKDTDGGGGLRGLRARPDRLRLQRGQRLPAQRGRGGRVLHAGPCRPEGRLLRSACTAPSRRSRLARPRGSEHRLTCLLAPALPPLRCTGVRLFSLSQTNSTSGTVQVDVNGTWVSVRQLLQGSGCGVPALDCMHRELDALRPCAGPAPLPPAARSAAWAGKTLTPPPPARACLGQPSLAERGRGTLQLPTAWARQSQRAASRLAAPCWRRQMLPASRAI